MMSTFLQAVFVTILCFKTANCVNEFAIENCIIEDNTTVKCNYFPKTIPAGIVRVRLVEFIPEEGDYSLTEEHFNDQSWMNVTVLELKDSKSLWTFGYSFGPMCFRKLQVLQELHIHVVKYYKFHTHALVGLSSLKTLDLSGSPRLLSESVATLLETPGTLPSLESISLGGIGKYVMYHNRFDSNFFKAIGKSPNITQISLNDLQTAVLDLCAMSSEFKYLKFVNLSYSDLQDMNCTVPVKQLHIPDILDFSYTKFPGRAFQIFPGKNVAANMSLVISRENSENIQCFLKAKVANLSGIVSQANPTATLWVYNVTLSLDESVDEAWNDSEMHLEQFELSDNRLKFYDVQIVCNVNMFSSIKRLGLSRNGLEMLHPSVLSCSPNLETVDLSENALFKMFAENETLFSQLLAGLPRLRSVSLANNNLTYLAESFFGNNSQLEHIDLSSNRLTQIHFIINGLKHLKILNLQANSLFILDDVSLNILNSISVTRILSRLDTEVPPTIMLQSNPLSCSSCESQKIINWILETELWYIYPRRITCRNERDLEVQVTEATLSEVEDICKRPMKTVVVVTCTASALLFVAAALLVYVKWRKRNQRFQHRRNVIQKLAKGQGRFKFAAFLSYSSRDNDFVTQNVLNRINEVLRTTTGIDRELVCTGDTEFRPGRRIFDELILCFQQSSVVFAVVSENFCDSPFCQDEINMACAEKKPVILMLKEHVEEARMSPNMQTLFRNNARIVWSVEDNILEVKPSWEKISEAVLDNIRLEQ